MKIKNQKIKKKEDKLVLYEMDGNAIHTQKKEEEGLFLTSEDYFLFHFLACCIIYY